VSPFDRPSSFSCHYLGVAAFDEVQLAVEPIRVGRGAASHRARLSQGDRPILEGTTPVGADGMLPFTSRVWTADGRLAATGGGQTLCRRVPPPPS
jgi:hypothetical protein